MNQYPAHIEERMVKAFSTFDKWLEFAKADTSRIALNAGLRITRSPTSIVEVTGPKIKYDPCLEWMKKTYEDSEQEFLAQIMKENPIRVDAIQHHCDAVAREFWFTAKLEVK